MRLRNIKGAQERILEDKYTIQTDGTNGSDYRGLWNKEIFHNDKPIHIEIGMGKGKFIMELASQNPDINYIGIEKYSSVLIRALEKREALESITLCFSVWTQRILKTISHRKRLHESTLTFQIHGQRTDIQSADLHQGNFLKDMIKFWLKMVYFSLKLITVLSLISH